MSVINTLTSLFSELIILSCWSLFVYFFIRCIGKVLPHILNWSRFWQVCVIILILPLLGNLLVQIETPIPDVLFRSFMESSFEFRFSIETASNDSAISPETKKLSHALVLFLIAGSCYFLLAFANDIRNVYQLIERSQTVENFPCLTEKQKVFLNTRNVQLKLCEHSVSPFVFGFFRTTLLLPSSVLSLAPKQQYLLIEHELVHIRRGDPKSVIVFRFLTSFFWFNPLFAYLEKNYVRTMELNCDSEVIARSSHSQLDYAQSLVASLKLNRSSAESGVIAHFFSARSKSGELAERIRSAMSNTSNHYYGAMSRLALLLIICFSVMSASVAKAYFVPLMKPYSNGVVSFDNERFGKLPVLKARVSSKFNSLSPLRRSVPHKGIDFAAPLGSAVLASFSGKVSIADDKTLNSNYGKAVLIKHSDERTSLYAHLDNILVTPGEYVAAGQEIGTVGETGMATGPHLHFEILESGVPVDPSSYLRLTVP